MAPTMARNNISDSTKKGTRYTVYNKLPIDEMCDTNNSIESQDLLSTFFVFLCSFASKSKSKINVWNIQFILSILKTSVIFILYGIVS